jgi:hypothetical protein
MKIYLGGETPMSKEAGWSQAVEGWQIGRLGKIIKRRLFSYFFHGYKINNRLSKEVQLSRECGMDLFLDSGAYSAFTQQKIIPVESYADFIHQHGDIFSLIANLDDIDDIGGGSKSWDNLKALETMGCAVFPVFHYEDDEHYLKKMIDNYSFIALGGLVGAHRSKLRIWLDDIWQRFLIRDDRTARLNVHGFGLTDFELMARYPWYSIDSSSWLQTGMFGGCVFYENGKLHKIVFSDQSNDKRYFDGWHYNCLSSVDRIKATIDKWLERHGVTAQQCASHYSFRHLVNAATYQSLESCGTDRLNF